VVNSGLALAAHLGMVDCARMMSLQAWCAVVKTGTGPDRLAGVSGNGGKRTHNWKDLYRACKELSV
jgi:hypothetical protein